MSNINVIMGGNIFKKLSKSTSKFFSKVGDGANHVFKKVGDGLNQVGTTVTKGIDKAGSFLEKNSGYLEDAAGGLAMITGNEALGAGLIAGGQATIDAQKMMKRKSGSTFSNGNKILNQVQNRTNGILNGTQDALQGRLAVGQGVASKGVTFG